MSYTNQYKTELKSLFSKRTSWLDTLLGIKKIGKPPKLNKKTINKSIMKIQDLASKALVNKVSKEEFENCAKQTKYRNIKGTNKYDRRKDIKDFYSLHFKSNRCVYLFFNKKGNCIYVGRTKKGKDRPASHYNKDWFKSAKRINIISTSKQNATKIECLAIHRYLPKENKNIASRHKWTSRCPICDIHKNIRKEMVSIFLK